MLFCRCRFFLFSLSVLLVCEGKWRRVSRGQRCAQEGNSRASLFFLTRCRCVLCLPPPIYRPCSVSSSPHSPRHPQTKVGQQEPPIPCCLRMRGKIQPSRKYIDLLLLLPLKFLSVTSSCFSGCSPLLKSLQALTQFVCRYLKILLFFIVVSLLWFWSSFSLSCFYVILPVSLESSRLISLHPLFSATTASVSSISSCLPLLRLLCMLHALLFRSLPLAADCYSC